MNRRDLLIGGAAAGAALALRPSFAFANHINAGNLPYGGVCTHILNKAQYYDPNVVGDYLQVLETKIVRDEWCPPGTGIDGFYRRLDAIIAKNPNTFWVFVAGRATEIDNIQNVLDQMEPYHRNILCVEGPNEWNLSGRATWKEELSDYTKELHRLMRAHPVMGNRYIVAPGLAYPKDSGPYFGNHGAYVDLGNLHFYQPSYQVDTRYLQESIDGANVVSGGKALWATELNGQIGDEIVRSDGYKPTEADQAWCYETIMAEAGKRGVHRGFCYQLFNWTKMYESDTTKENQFGCFRKDFTRKPLADKVLAANRRG